ncbi:hypothetical protein [Marinicella meishanensis]|uniref:hypothetical protein n=1 Tax=Marinicella meishanensis TaxID=2873263 RepID=UPI001CC17CC3|nr:hypothetical protein [Marinicella sp. NBU2979]
MDWSLSNPSLLSGLLAVITGLLLWWYAYHSPKALIDVSEDRSLHRGRAITGAGLYLFLPFALMGLWLYPLFVPLSVILLLSVLGYLDDRFKLSFQLRLWCQLAAAMLTLWSVGVDAHLGWQLFLVLGLLWWVNLFNFMDGANGMAGLHALVSLACYGVIFGQAFSQDSVFTYLTWAGVVLMLIYLLFNLILKKLFMGDSGSLPLAWLQAVLALYAMAYDLLTPLQVAMLHVVFIVDATATLMVRLKRGENITAAHSTHFYQRLIKSGWAHWQVSLAYAAVSLLCGLLVVMTQSATTVVQYAQSFVVYGLGMAVFIKFYKLGR